VIEVGGGHLLGADLAGGEEAGELVSGPGAEGVHGAAGVARRRGLV